ncbi:MAG: DUF6470 family protein [Clostridia bacterium]|nr:DUF6470 family protein [Clostridia bacterium]
MGLTISQTFAQIGIERTQSKFEISTQSAKLEVNYKQAKVNIDSELPRVIIDQREAFASAGLKNYLELTKEAARRGIQQALEYIGNTAADGDQLAAIENKGNPIPAIAEKNAYPVHEFNIDCIPKVGPKIEVTGSLKIEPERNWEGANNGVHGDYTPPRLDVNYTPQKLNIFLKQYASISFDYQPKNVDIKL